MNLLERTRRLLQGLTPASPAKVQYYSVACPEGHRLRGERTEGYQALRCPTCGEGIFVLPRSPLPEPVAAESGRGSQAARVAVDTEREDEPVHLSDPIVAPPPEAATSDVDGEIEWVDPEANGEEPDADQNSNFFESLSVPEQAAQGRAVENRRPAGSKQKQSEAASRERQVSGSTRGPRADDESPRIAVAARESFTDWAHRRRNPLIFLGVALIVVATVGFRFWRSKVRDLPQVVEIARVQGLEALDAGDFDTAHQLLSDGKRAVDALGGAVEGAAEVRHGAEEAAIFTTLVPEPLEQILIEASADGDEAKWSSRFATFYKGRSLFLDCTVRAVPDATGAGSYDLDYRIIPNGEGNRPRVGRIDLTGFRLFELTQPKLGDRVQFGARLASFTYDRVSKEWLAGLEPDSGVFLSHPRALEAIGRPAPEEASGEELP